MPTQVVMPQMGESVAEGTIVRWIKKVGEVVERDEPLFEISTDKVDAEIPSPAAGVLSEIKVKEGETVAVNSVVAVIGDASGAAADGPVSNPIPVPSATVVKPASATQGVASARQAPSPQTPGLSKPWSAAEARGLRLSPLVRKIAKEHHIDVRNIAGSGAGGRITKADILYKKDINIGVAVALDWGLIVPVIKNADRKSLLEISKAIIDVASRARDKKLAPDDVQGGTFTITNPGVFGALFGMPIINQPQVAILGVGAVEKRPVVVNDAITIRVRAYMTLGYDHRIIDGAVADEFMSHMKKTLENFDPAQA